MSDKNVVGYVTRTAPFTVRAREPRGRRVPDARTGSVRRLAGGRAPAPAGSAGRPVLRAARAGARRPRPAGSALRPSTDVDEGNDLEAAPELQEPSRLVGILATDLEAGLSDAEAASRLRRHGANELPSARPEPLVTRFLRQFLEPMALLLLGAAALSGIGLREGIDATTITAIVLLNAVIGTVQEGRAAQALEALRDMETPTTTARRGGRNRAVPSRELVAGDLVVLQAGDRVPADVRLTSTRAFEIDESLLTGESLPVAKDARARPRPGVALAEQRWMAFSGTLVTRGTAEGIVVRTGAATRFGRLAVELSRSQPPTPLQVELAGLTARLGSVAVAIAAVVLGLSLLRSGTAGARDKPAG